MRTAESEQMTAIVAGFASLMKQQGFRKRRHCFNRTMESGLVHVINFWQHPKEPPAWTEVPGLRERRYGTFRVDFGVYVPEIQRFSSPRSDWINEYNCHLRRTFGRLEGATEDMWLALDAPQSVEHTRSTIEDYGLPWLARFPSQDSVLDEFLANGAIAIGMTPAGGLDVADMLIALGRDAKARSVLEAYVSRSVLKSHAEYLADYLTTREHGDLADRITTHDPQV